MLACLPWELIGRFFVAVGESIFKFLTDIGNFQHTQLLIFISYSQTVNIVNEVQDVRGKTPFIQPTL